MLREHLRAESFRLPSALMARSPAVAAGYVASAHLWLAALVLAGRYLPGGAAAKLALGFLLALLAQRALQTLVHHLSHDLLTRKRALNDALGNFLVAGFIGMRVQSYRRIHFVHHAENGSVSDPEFIDFSTVREKGGLGRYILHYALGGELLALMRKYYFPGEKSPGASPAGMLHIAACQIFLIALCAWVAQAWYLYLVWLYVAVSWSPMLSRLRFLVEHPGKDDRTVSTVGPWHEVLLFAPYRFNYHFEHHAWPALPPYRLHRAHGELRAAGYFERHPEYCIRSYVRALRAADAGLP
jgi:fatty acid desaturase